MVRFVIVHIPVVVTAISVGVHALGVLELIPHPSFTGDLSMSVIDLLVIYGLLKKMRWGYFLACLLYVQQSIMQPYWAYCKYNANFFILHWVEIFLAPLLVISTFCFLILNKRYFIR